MRPWLRRSTDLALLAFPRPFRRRFGPEMRAAVGELVGARRLASGRAAAFALAVRALLDILVAGLRARATGAVAPVPAIPTRRSSPTMLDSSVSDLRHALRTLARTPMFTIAAVVVLALGIGATGAMLSAVRTALLDAPPYPDPDQLVTLSLTFPFPDRAEPELVGWSYPKFRTLLAQPSLGIDPIAGFTRRTVTLSGREADALRLEAEVVSSAYLPTLGARPAHGRLFAPEDPAAGIPPPQLAAVLDHELFERRFGGDASILGRPVQINGHPVTVVGVLEPGFRGLSGPSDLWLTMSAMPTLFNPRQLRMAHAHWFDVIGRDTVGRDTVGRTAAGTEHTQLDARVAAAGAAIDRAFPDSYFEEPVGATARRLAEARRSPDAERSLWLLTAAAVLIVLIACANVAALFEARTAARRRAISIRGALGASRAAVVRHVMVEAALLAAAGGAVGLLVASWLGSGLVRFWPQAFRQGDSYLELSHLDALHLGAGDLLVVLALAAVLCGFFGLGPALRLSALVRVPQRALRAAGVSADAGRSLAARGALVAGQAALAVMLAIGAALLLATLGRLQRVEVGAATDGLLSFDYEVPASSADAERPGAFHARLLERLEALPGVAGVAFGDPPLGEHSSITGVRSVDGGPEIEAGGRPAIGFHRVSDDHFRLLGVPLLAGRGFDRRDHAEAPPAVVINRTAARELFGTDDAVGRRLALGMDLTPSGVSAEVIGVVGDVLYRHPTAGVMPEAYVSYRQEDWRDMTVMVRTVGEPLAFVPEIRARVRTLDPDLPLFGVRTVAQIGSEAIGDTRVLASLLLGFALLALTLAAVGTYGVTAFWVAGRRRELGLRLALGARRSDVVRLVVGRGLRAVAVGLAVGLAGALASAHLLDRLLYGVTSRDPLTFGAATLVLIAVAALASYLPARKAARVDPVTTLADP